MKRLILLLCINTFLQGAYGDSFHFFLTNEVIPFPLVKNIDETLTDNVVEDFFSISDCDNSIFLHEEPISISLMEEVAPSEQYWECKYSNYSFYLPVKNFKYISADGKKYFTFINSSQNHESAIVFSMDREEISLMHQFGKYINLPIYLKGDFYVQAPMDGKTSISLREGLFDGNYYDIAIFHGSLIFTYSRVTLTISDEVYSIKRGEEIGYIHTDENSVSTFDLTIWSAEKREHVKPAIIYMVHDR